MELLRRAHHGQQKILLPFAINHPRVKPCLGSRLRTSSRNQDDQGQHHQYMKVKDIIFIVILGFLVSFGWFTHSTLCRVVSGMALSGFSDDPKASNEGILEKIQMAWHEEYSDR